MKTRLISWDIDGTLILRPDMRLVRENCLDLLAQAPKQPLIKGIEESMQTIRAAGALQGVVSDYAYQFAINLLTSSKARDYIDPRLIFLANKYAWEGMVLDDKSYDEVLAEYAKPSPRMLQLSQARVSEILKQPINPQDCVYIGNESKDEQMANAAGWKFLHITHLPDLGKCL
ncbi:MAG: HAD family hydrolase [Candidatus Pacearchaeota archaeon]|jgi:phosphoglycolate phosphatase-like HAD superfamily hydrolase